MDNIIKKKRTYELNPKIHVDLFNKRIWCVNHVQETT